MRGGAYGEMVVVGLIFALIVATTSSLMLFMHNGHTNEGYFDYYRYTFFTHFTVCLAPLLLIPPFFFEVNLTFFFVLTCFILFIFYSLFKGIELVHKSI